MARVILLTDHEGILKAKLQRLEVGSSTRWHQKAALESLKHTVEQQKPGRLIFQTSVVGTVQLSLYSPSLFFYADECLSIAKSLSKTLSTSPSSFIYCHAFSFSSKLYAITLTRKLPPTHKW